MPPGIGYGRRVLNKMGLGPEAIGKHMSGGSRSARRHSMIAERGLARSRIC